MTPFMAKVRPFDEYRPKQKDRSRRASKVKTVGTFTPKALSKQEQARLKARLCYERN